jgi:hypothetical protein
MRVAGGQDVTVVNATTGITQTKARDTLSSRHLSSRDVRIVCPGLTNKYALRGQKRAGAPELRF